MYVSVKWKVNFLATHVPENNVPLKHYCIMGENDDLKSLNVYSLCPMGIIAM